MDKLRGQEKMLLLDNLFEYKRHMDWLIGELNQRSKIDTYCIAKVKEMCEKMSHEIPKLKLNLIFNFK